MDSQSLRGDTRIWAKTMEAGTDSSRNVFFVPLDESQALEI